MRPRLHFDLETFSTVNLLTAGARVYAEKAVPLLTGLKLNDEATQVFDHSEAFNAGMDDFGEFDTDYAPECPELLKEAVKDGWWIVAHNWDFEYSNVYEYHKRLGWPLPKIEQFICTAAKARYWGLSGTLAKAGQMLNLPVQKDKEGGRLIKKFCVPQKYGRGAKAGTYIRTIDQNDPDWLHFKRYNRDDVETEYGIDVALPDIPEKFAKSFYMDARMNVRGFPVDIDLVKNALEFNEHFSTRLEKRFKELSGGLAPTQVAKVKEVVNSSIGLGLGDTLDNLQSATIRDALLEDDRERYLAPEAREMLEIRAETAKASIKKLLAFLARTAADLRAHGGFLWYGAHTGRWSGKGIQPQNFPRGTKAALKQLNALWKLLNNWERDICLSVAEMVYTKPLDVLASALRGFIKAPKGKKFYSADYAQIELRVLAWLAGEAELLEQLRGGLDPYIQFAGNYMYDVDPSTIAKDSLERQIAKSALLGAQYQIWIPAFIEYCKATAGLKISIEEATNAILSYRDANPNIVDFWKDIEKAAIFAVETQSEAKLNNLRLRYEVHNGRDWLRIYLPSGRPISYFEPQVRLRVTEHEKTDKDGNLVWYLNEEGERVVATYTKKKKVLSFLTEWMGKIQREYTYGGKITENVTQGTSADIMSTGLCNAEEAGYLPIMTVHDDGTAEVDEGFGSVEEFERLLCTLPSCYDGLPIKAEGFECTQLRKG